MTTNDRLAAADAGDNAFCTTDVGQKGDGRRLINIHAGRGSVDVARPIDGHQRHRIGSVERERRGIGG